MLNRKEYKVEIKETLVKIFQNEEFESVRRNYINEVYTLTDEDIYTTNIFISTRPKNPKLKNFKDNEVAIIETLSKEVLVYANSAKEAVDIVTVDYNDKAIVLDYNDFVCVEIQ